jgi:hypothetical protein
MTGQFARQHGIVVKELDSFDALASARADATQFLAAFVESHPHIVQNFDVRPTNLDITTELGEWSAGQDNGTPHTDGRNSGAVRGDVGDWYFRYPVPEHRFICIYAIAVDSGYASMYQFSRGADVRDLITVEPFGTFAVDPTRLCWNPGSTFVLQRWTHGEQLAVQTHDRLFGLIAEPVGTTVTASNLRFA